MDHFGEVIALEVMSLFEVSLRWKLHLFSLCLQSFVDLPPSLLQELFCIASRHGVAIKNQNQ